MSFFLSFPLLLCISSNAWRSSQCHLLHDVGAGGGGDDSIVVAAADDDDDGKEEEEDR